MGQIELYLGSNMHDGKAKDFVLFDTLRSLGSQVDKMLHWMSMES
jgi:hypothetical protein